MFIKKVELHRHGKVNKKDCRQWFITGTVQELFWIQSPLIFYTLLGGWGKRCNYCTILHITFLLNLQCASSSYNSFFPDFPCNTLPSPAFTSWGCSSWMCNLLPSILPEPLHIFVKPSSILTKISLWKEHTQSVMGDHVATWCELGAPCPSAWQIAEDGSKDND